MKKIYSLLIFCVFFLFPLKALAAVDIALRDTSTSSVQSISISIDSGTDTLENILLAIRVSDDVEVKDVNTGTINCTSFDFTQDTESVKITCDLGEEKAINGVFANIIFSSDSKTYSFSLIEDSSELGSVTLGEVTNVGTEATTLTEDIEEEEEEEYKENDNMEFTGTPETGIMDQVEKYLPYILIAGSVVLLISIVGIILSKKKTPKDGGDSGSTDLGSAPTAGIETPASTENTNTPDISQEGTLPQTESPTQEPTLKDMVNQNTVAQPIQPEITTENPSSESIVTEASVDTNIPVQAETPTTTPVTNEPTSIMPEITMTTPQENSTPAPVETTIPISTTPDENQDLKELMEKEETSSTQQQIPPVQQEVPFNADLNVNTTPTTATENIIPEINQGLASPDVYLNRIQEETNNLASQTTGIESDATVEASTDIPQTPPNL